MENNLLSLLDAKSYDTMKKLAKVKNRPVSLFLRELIQNANMEDSGFYRMGGTTLNYDQFKVLNGNRSIEPARIDNIIRSIRKVGYITNPIIVNEKMEVIDGQGRLEALRQLDLPVDYIIHRGAGIDECIAMNVYQKNWTSMDYIKSFADQGNKHYLTVIELMDEFIDLPANTVVSACTNQLSEMNGRVIKGGRFEVKKPLNEIRQFLSYLLRFNDLTLGAKKVRFSGQSSSAMNIHWLTVKDWSMPFTEHASVSSLQSVKRFN